MPLFTGSSHAVIGDSMPKPVVPSIPQPSKASRHIPKPRAIQKPRAIGKVVVKPAGLDHYKPRG